MPTCAEWRRLDDAAVAAAIDIVATDKIAKKELVKVGQRRSLGRFSSEFGAALVERAARGVSRRGISNERAALACRRDVAYPTDARRSRVVATSPSSPPLAAPPAALSSTFRRRLWLFHSSSCSLCRCWRWGREGVFLGDGASAADAAAAAAIDLEYGDKSEAQKAAEGHWYVTGATTMATHDRARGGCGVLVGRF